MRTMTVVFALFGLLGLLGCGKDAEPTKSPAPASAPATPTPPTKPPVPADAPSFIGTLAVEGPSATMQGTHQLVEGGKVVCLLESKTVDLAAYVGKRVKVTGPARPTTENNQTIVDVQRIDVLP